MFTVRKFIEIDAGHRVPYHGSKCRNLHGHRYRITAVVSAPELVPAESRRSDAGMVMDFGDIKQALMDVIHDRFDHKLILWAEDPLLVNWKVYPEAPTDPFQMALMEQGLTAGLVVVPCIPTAEELARYWGSLLETQLAASPYLRLDAVEVHETPTSIATWERVR